MYKMREKQEKKKNENRLEIYSKSEHDKKKRNVDERWIKGMQKRINKILIKDIKKRWEA